MFPSTGAILPTTTEATGGRCLGERLSLRPGQAGRAGVNSTYLFCDDWSKKLDRFIKKYFFTTIVKLFNLLVQLPFWLVSSSTSMTSSFSQELSDSQHTGDHQSMSYLLMTSHISNVWSLTSYVFECVIIRVLSQGRLTYL